MAETRTFTRAEFERYLGRATALGRIEMVHEAVDAINDAAAELFREREDSGALKLRDIADNLRGKIPALQKVVDDLASKSRQDQMLAEAEALNAQLTVPDLETVGEPELENSIPF